jgi:hypothetical protein
LALKGVVRMTTIYMDQTGPLVRYGDGLLLIEDLNPEVKTQWRMSRADMLRFAWRCVRAALSK